MINLLAETIEDIKSSGRTPEEIIFIGSEISGHQCTWEEFKTLANRNYDNGYGSAEVAMDLIIVFSDGCKLHRGEYDGSEWWEIQKPFKRPEVQHTIKSLFITDYRSSLAECNDDTLGD